MPANHTRRALVLTDEKARHPFRSTLPPHVSATLVRESWLRSLKETLTREWYSVAATYCASFCAAMVFFA